ncbi:hypothetical protein FKW77_001736 [Venturia effusa]|uniref:Uncharacterized protein n=1 Tax=Venturia effusa TaxID=50376 RepID=A0A517L0T4_9PEZI|nr:hypothetical protein FKW77_001736 [Venturia effusa]
MAPKKAPLGEEKPKKGKGKKPDGTGTPAPPQSERRTTRSRATPGTVVPTTLFGLDDPEPRRLRSKSPDKQVPKGRLARIADKEGTLSKIKEELEASPPHEVSPTKPPKPEGRGNGRSRGVNGRQASNPLDPTAGIRFEKPSVTPASRSPTKPTRSPIKPAQTTAEEPGSPDEEAGSPLEENDLTSDPDEETVETPETVRRRQKEEKLKEKARSQEKKKRQDEARELEKRKADNAKKKEKEDRAARKKLEAAEKKRKGEEKAAREREEAEQREQDEEDRKADEARKQAEHEEAERKKRDEQRDRLELEQRLERQRETAQVIGQPSQELPDYEVYERQDREQELALDGSVAVGPDTATEQAASTMTTPVKDPTRIKASGAGAPGSNGSSSPSSESNKSGPERRPSPRKTPSPEPSVVPRSSASKSGSRESIISRKSLDPDAIQNDNLEPLVAGEFRSALQRYGSRIDVIEGISDSVGAINSGAPNLHERLDRLDDGQVDVQRAQKNLQKAVNDLKDNIGIKGFGEQSIRATLKNVGDAVSDLQENVGAIEEAQKGEKHVDQKLKHLDADMKERHSETFAKIDDAVEKTTKHISGRLDKSEEARARDAQETAKKFDALERAQQEQQEAQREHREETKNQFRQLLDAITSNRKRKRGHGGGDGDGDGDSSQSDSDSDSESDADGREGPKKKPRSVEPEGYDATDTGSHSPGETGPGRNDAQGAQKPIVLDSELDHSMPPPPFSRTPTPKIEKRKVAEVDDNQDGNGGRGPAKKAKIVAAQEQDHSGNYARPHRANTMPPSPQVEPLGSTHRRVQGRKEDLAHDFGPECLQEEKANRTRVENPSESKPAAQRLKRATFKPRPETLHKLTEEEKAAKKAQASPQGNTASEYTIKNLMPGSGNKPPIHKPNRAPPPGAHRSTGRQNPAPRPPPPQQHGGTTEDSHQTPSRFDLGRMAVNPSAAVNAAPQTRPSMDHGPATPTPAQQGPSGGPETYSNDEEEDDDLDDEERDFTISGIPQDPPASPIGPFQHPTEAQLRREAGRYAALQAGNPPPPGHSPNINLVYDEDGDLAADFGDSTLLMTPTGLQRIGPGEYSPMIPVNDQRQTPQGAPIAMMLPPRYHLTPIATPVDRASPHRTSATPQTPRPAGRSTPNQTGRPTSTASRRSRTSQTPRAPSTPSSSSTTRTINNHGGPSLPHVDGPRKGSGKKRKAKTPVKAAPSGLSNVKNASTLSSPSTATPPVSPPRPPVPVEPIDEEIPEEELTDDDPDSLSKFTSSELAEDSDRDERYDEDYSEIPPDNSEIDFNPDFQAMIDNSRLDAAQSDEESVDYYSPNEEAYYVQRDLDEGENIEYTSAEGDGDSSPYDESTSLPYDDEDTINTGDREGDYVDFHDPLADVSYDEVEQDLGGPKTDSEDEVEGSVASLPDMSDEETRRQYPGLDGIEDDSRFIDEADIGNAEGYDALQSSFLDDSVFHDRPGVGEEQNLSGQRTVLPDGSVVETAVVVDEQTFEGELELQFGGGIDDDPNARDELERARRDKLRNMARRDRRS